MAMKACDFKKKGDNVVFTVRSRVGAGTNQVDRWLCGIDELNFSYLYGRLYGRLWHDYSYATFGGLGSGVK